MLRGIFCFALVWLCMGAAPKIEGLEAALCVSDACADPVAEQGKRLRAMVQARLLSVRQELRQARADG